MSWDVKEVPLQYVNQIWPRVEAMLAKSVKHSNGELSLEEAKVNAVKGWDTLFVAVDSIDDIQGVVAVSFTNRSDNRVAYVTNIGGRFLADKETFAKFCELLRAYGATCIEGAARDSLVRLWARLGAHKKTNIVQIPL